MLKVNKREVIFNYILIFIIICCIIYNFDGKINKVVSIIILCLTFFELIKTRKSKYLLIINLLILYCNYSICLPNYFVDINTSFTEFSNQPVAALAINILCIFILTLYLTAPRLQSDFPENIEPITKSGHYNSVFLIGICIVLIIIWRFGFTRPEVSGMRGTPSAIYEYSVILVIIGFFYCGDKLIWKIILSLIIGIYAIQNFIYGGRITGIQIIICGLLCMFIHKITIKKILVGSAIVIPVMSLIGVQRGAVEFSLNNIGMILKASGKTYGTLDTAYSAYYTSITFLKAMDYTALETRLKMFGNFMLSMLFGSVVPNSNLADYTRERFLHYWGGITPYFFFFYLGIGGVILSAIYISYLKKKITSYEKPSGFIQCLAIYITATTFRWYLYSPSQLLRGVMFLWIVYQAAAFFYKLVQRK